MRLLTILLATMLLTTACSSGTTTPDAAQDIAGIRVLGANAAAALIDAEPDRTIIDVRTPEEFSEGHIDGAILIDFNAPDFTERVAELDPEQSYLIYCRSGNRSAGARAIVSDLGFSDVVDIEGGIIAWNGAGLPTV